MKFSVYVLTKPYKEDMVKIDETSDHVKDSLKYLSFNMPTIPTGKDLDALGQQYGVVRIVEDDAAYRERIQKQLRSDGVVNTIEPIVYKQIDSVVKDYLVCDHSWQKYQGLMEQYDFCEKCQEKENNVAI